MSKKSSQDFFDKLNTREAAKLPVCVFVGGNAATPVRNLCREAAPRLGELSAVRLTEGSPEGRLEPMGKESVHYKYNCRGRPLCRPALTIKHNIKIDAPRQNQPVIARSEAMWQSVLLYAARNKPQSGKEKRIPTHQ